MFGRAYWGGRYYGPAYWGDGSDTPPESPAGQIPKATRLRVGHRTNWVHRVVMAVAGGLWV